MLWLEIYMILVSLLYIFSFVFLFRMRESKIVRRALLSTLLIIFSFSFAVFSWAKYPVLFKGFERYFILVPIVALWVPIMYTQDMAFVFLAPYHWLIEKRKNSQMTQAMEHFWEFLSPRTFKAFRLKFLFYYINLLIFAIPFGLASAKIEGYFFVGGTFTIPWFVKVISLLYISSYLSSLFLLLIHRRIRRCLSALLSSALISPIISFGLYVGKINPLFSNFFAPFPAIEVIYLALLMFFLIFAFAWLDLFFFLAFPYLFLLSKVNKKREDSLEWIYDFPSSLSKLDIRFSFLFIQIG